MEHEVRPYLYKNNIITYFGLTLAVLFLSFIFGLCIKSSPASAAVPPESCFVFSTSTGAISRYYDNEGDDAANPACTRDVDIPGTISGVAVTTISASSFSNKNITSVTIPDSVTTIIGGAFQDNNLTSLVLPDSVANVGYAAFYNNNLTSLTISSSMTFIADFAFSHNSLTSITIPNSVTNIGNYAFSNNSLTSVAIPISVTQVGLLAFSANNLKSVFVEGSPVFGRAPFALNGESVAFPDGFGQIDNLENVRFVPVYGNNLNIEDEVDSEASLGGDLNGDGDTTDYLGGHIVNPATLTVRYIDQHGNSVAPDTVEVGDGIADYFVSSLLAVNPAPTSADAIELYYHQGDTITKTAPVINGLALVSASEQSTLLNATGNLIVFQYNNPNSTVPTAPDTGVGTSIWQVIILTVGIIGLSVVSLVKVLLKNRS